MVTCDVDWTVTLISCLKCALPEKFSHHGRDMGFERGGALACDILLCVCSVPIPAEVSRNPFSLCAVVVPRPPFAPCGSYSVFLPLFRCSVLQERVCGGFRCLQKEMCRSYSDCIIAIANVPFLSRCYFSFFEQVRW